MLNHQRLHTGDYKDCVCGLCVAVYSTSRKLNRHVRNAHQGLRNNKCLHCDKAFHNKRKLERHINSQHTETKIWPRPVCRSRYDRKDDLRIPISYNHSNVVNPDTVELNNDESQMDVKPKPRRRNYDGEADHPAEAGSQSMWLKHWEDVPQYRQIPTPEIKHEVVPWRHFEHGGQLAQCQVKLETPVERPP